MAKVGDTVRYLDAVGGGRIVKIEGKIAYVDEDGFETPVLWKDCIVVAQGTEPSPEEPAAAAGAQEEAPVKSASDQAIAVEETPTGDVMNLVLAYEPADLRRLGTTVFDTYLVNDSNYFLYFTYLTRGGDSRQWTLRYAGIVEPNIQLWLGELSYSQLPEIDRVALQLIAFKRGKEFQMKTPVSVEQRLDTTKFCKLHCFQENPYFDNKVIALDIVKEDCPVRPEAISIQDIEAAISKDRPVEFRGPSKSISKKERRRMSLLEVDLHINELLDSTAGLTNTDMLNVQLKEFNRVMEENLQHKGEKIVFIPGKGEGVLRQALLKELKKKYPRCEAQDASFREYGFGATQVTIH